MLVTERVRPATPSFKHKLQQPSFTRTLCCSGFRCDYMTKTPALKIPEITSNPISDHTYSLAEMKLHRHNVIINDDSMKTYQSKLEIRQRFCRGFERAHSIGLAPPENPLLATITSSLNKLSKENFQSIFLELTKHPEFGTDDYVELLAQTITNAASKQSNFGLLYAQLAHQMGQKLPPIFSMLIEGIVFDEFSLDEGLAYFIGCLSSVNLLPISEITEYCHFLLSENSQISIQCLVKLCTPIIKILEQDIVGREILNTLVKLKTSSELPLRIQFLIADLVETFTPKPPPPVETPVDGTDSHILTQFIVEKTVSAYWSLRLTRELFFSLVTTTTKNFNAGVKIFKILKEKKHVKEGDMIKIMNETIFKFQERLQDYPQALKRCGMLYSILIGYELLHFPLFGMFVPFNAQVFMGMLQEANKQDLFEKISRSPWMANLEFLPDIVAYLPVVDAISKSEMFDIWPAFDAIVELFEQMNNGVKPKDLDLSDYSEVLETKLFSIIVAEVIVMCKPELYAAELIGYIAKFPDDCLDHIIELGLFYNWDAKGTAREVRGLANGIQFPLDKWKVKNGSDFHNQVCSLIP